MGKWITVILSSIAGGIMLALTFLSKWGRPNQDTGGATAERIDTKLGEAGKAQQGIADELGHAGKAVDGAIGAASNLTGLASDDGRIFGEFGELVDRNTALARELRRRHETDPLDDSD